jgi:hypothetical protein
MAKAKDKLKADPPANDGTGATFLVLEGKHTEEDGKVYKKGDKVTSPAPLDEMFANKFQRLEGVTHDPRDYDKTFDNDDVMDELLTEKDKPGGTGDEAEPDDAHEGEETDHGTDVSSKFKEAADADLVVFRTEDGGYNVADKDNPAKSLNKKPLKFGQVRNFLKNQTGGK